MAVELIVNDDTPRVQYIVTTPTENTFVYAFSIFEADNLKVYLTPNWQIPDPDTDLLPSTAYTVTINSLANNTGTVILNTPAVTGDIFTIVRDIPMTQKVDYSVGGPLTAASINFVIDKMTLLIQQVNSLIEDRGLTYEDTTQLDPDRKDNRLPKLAAGQIWQKTASSGIQPADAVEPVSCSSLRTELAEETAGIDGARIVGYFSSQNGATTVKDELDDLRSEITFEEHKVKVTAADTVADYLNNSLQAGTGINLTLLNPGADEKIEISSTSGKVAQDVVFTFGNFLTSSAVIPFDNTIPQITEGFEIMTASITPLNAASKIIISAGINYCNNSGTNDPLTTCIFRVSVNDALAASYNQANTSDAGESILCAQDTAGTTSAITYALRAGRAGANPININGSGGPLYNGKANTFIRLTEVLP